MMTNHRNSRIEVLQPRQAFTQQELAWFSEFERDVELWRAVDTLFPEPKLSARAR